MPSQRYADAIPSWLITNRYGPIHIKIILTCSKEYGIMYKEYKYSLYISVRVYKKLWEEIQIKRYSLSTNR